MNPLIEWNPKELEEDIQRKTAEKLSQDHTFWEESYEEIVLSKIIPLFGKEALKEIQDMLDRNDTFKIYQNGKVEVGSGIHFYLTTKHSH